MNHSKYKIALFKNDQYVGYINYMNTGNLKWFKSKETAQNYYMGYSYNEFDKIYINGKLLYEKPLEIEK